MMNLRDLGNVPFGISVMGDVFHNSKAVVAKTNRLEHSSDIIRLKKGLYVVNPMISGIRINEFLIANHLYGPSYVSMQSALRFYGLIPERVHEIRSMTSRLAKAYSNKIANFTYIHCPEEYFSIGITVQQEEGVSYIIATPEKALCDLMIYTSNLNLRYMREIREFLENDIRFEMSELAEFNLDLLKEIRDKGKKKQMISQLIKFIHNERNV